MHVTVADSTITIGAKRRPIRAAEATTSLHSSHNATIANNTPISTTAVMKKETPWAGSVK
jgi:hypothetical protein